MRQPACLMLLATFALPAIAQEQMQPLFDGRSLDGWVVRSGFAKYHVEDGAIVGTTAEGSPNTFLCTSRPYGDFIFEAEVKCDPRLNSGFQIRSHVYEQPTELQTVSPSGQVRLRRHEAGRVYGYQVEVATAERGTAGGIYDEARRGWLENISDDAAASKAFRDNEWNHYRVVAIGDSIRTWVNGVPCADLRDAQDLIGFIGLQVHGIKTDMPLQVRWRNLKIADLGMHTWVPLMDRRTPGGWHAVGGGEWRSERGVLIGVNTKSNTQRPMLFTDDVYKDFTARIVFKAVEGNSGFFFRTQKLDEQGLKIAGFQAEIDATKDVGGLFETGGRGWVVRPDPEAVATYFKPAEWNEMIVSAHGGRIVIHLNGVKTVDVNDDPRREAGHFALQLHARQDVQVQFKTVEILQPLQIDPLKGR